MNPYKLKKPNRYLFFIVFLMIGLFSVSAQEKLEKEYRLQAKEIPTEALSFIDSLHFQNKIKWYKEEGVNQESIEAKTKQNGNKYSIEFDTKGKLQDIEMETDWDPISESVKNNIQTYLDSQFSTYVICKIQLQYSGERKNLLALISKGENDKSYTLKYEIVLKGKNKNGKHLYEFLFSEEGTFEKMSKIIFRSTDNMEF